MDFQDILYEIRNGVAWITINRPDKMNAFRGTTCDELIRALNKAGYDKAVGCIVLAGAGDRAGTVDEHQRHRPALGPVLAGGIAALVGGTAGWRWAFVIRNGAKR